MRSDAELIDATLDGDRPSYGELVRRYQERLFASMAHWLGQPEEAEDVVQEAFVQAYLKLETFQRTSGFYTWIYRIAFNVAASRQRRRRPTASIERRREDGHEPISAAEPVGAGLEREEDVQRVRAALDRLGEDHKAIMVLRELEGFDYETIGQMLDIPVGTVRSRLHRARLQLRDLLKTDLTPG